MLGLFYDFFDHRIDCFVFFSINALIVFKLFQSTH